MPELVIRKVDVFSLCGPIPSLRLFRGNKPIAGKVAEGDCSPSQQQQPTSHESADCLEPESGKSMNFLDKHPDRWPRSWDKVTEKEVSKPMGQADLGWQSTYDLLEHLPN